MESTEYEFPQGMNRPPPSSTDGGEDREGEVEGQLEETEGSRIDGGQDREGEVEGHLEESEGESDNETESDSEITEDRQRATRVLVKPEPKPERYASYAL